MPNAKISALPSATLVKTTDEFPINQDGTTKKVTLEQIQNSVSFPTGGVMMFTVSGVPTGWLECNGDVLAISKYTNLYNVIGQNYKTLNNFNTLSGFQIPDLRGQFVRGWNHGRQTGGDTLTARGIGTSQSDEFKLHTHSVTDNGHFHNIKDQALYDTGHLGEGAGIDGGPINQIPDGTWPSMYTERSTTGITIVAAGSSTETRPRNVALVYCIKA